MHYDSFGRSHRQLFPSRFEDAVGTEFDVEQDERTAECGQRLLAWLLLFDQLGSSAAKMIYKHSARGIRNPFDSQEGQGRIIRQTFSVDICRPNFLMCDVKCIILRHGDVCYRT